MKVDVFEALAGERDMNEYTNDTVFVLSEPVIKRDPDTLMPVYPDDPRYDSLPFPKYS